MRFWRDRRTREAEGAQERLASLMNHTHETILCLDFIEPVDITLPEPELIQALRNARLVESSRKFARSLGHLSREDVLGQHMMDLLGGMIPDWFAEFGREVHASGFRDLERIVPVKVGDEVRNMRIYMQNIMRDGRLTRQWITLRDVTGDEQRKSQLQASERTKSLALQAADLFTYQVDFVTGEVQVDPDGLHGIVNGADSLTRWGEQIHRDDVADARRVLHSFRIGETENLHQVLRISDVDGKDRGIELWGRATERDTDGSALGVAGVFRDITADRELQAKLDSARNLETVGRLAGGVAHDFNNLLMTILGSAELASMGHADKDQELKRIIQATEQASFLCHQLLAYAGEGKSEKTTVDLTQITRTMIDLAGSSALRGISVEVAATRPVWVNGNASQLGQVVMNLLKNASEAVYGTGGTMGVEVGTCDHEPAWATSHHMGLKVEPGTYGYVEVRDSGAGMSADEVARIFDPFYTTKFAGRGLGMAVVLAIVSGHGGAIAVDSHSGAGTTVRVVIPATDPREPSTG